MAKKRNEIHAFELQLRRNVEARTGKKCEPWLYPQIEATAYTRGMMIKIYDEIDREGLSMMVTGSMGQVKPERHPLFDMFAKMDNILTMQYTSLGLNFGASPGKITENTKQGGEEHDKLFSLLESVKSN